MKKIILSLSLLIGSAPLFAKDDINTLNFAARTGDQKSLENIINTTKPSSWALHRAFQEASLAGHTTVLKFLLERIETKSNLLSWACSYGQESAVKTLLEDDANTMLMASIASHAHILEAKDTGHIEIAKMVRDHLVNKGYGYASTIKLED